jgi:hypothetical protein
MLILREAQLVALRAAARDSFARSIYKGALEKLPRLCAGRDKRATLDAIGRALDKAAEWGIDGPDDQIFFAWLALAHGPDFDQDPELNWTAPILKNPILDGNAKMAVIADRLPARLHPSAISWR